MDHCFAAAGNDGPVLCVESSLNSSIVLSIDGWPQGEEVFLHRGLVGEVNSASFAEVGY